MLNVGIPPYRLPREVVQQAIEEIERLGVEIISRTPIGKELNLEGLRKEYDAVYIAAGAHKAEKLGIPGEDLQGVIHGVTFMQMVNLGKDLEIGQRVAVVGGGNTAMDTARSSLRLGAKEVFILYRRTREEMPVDPRGTGAGGGRGNQDPLPHHAHPGPFQRWEYGFPGFDAFEIDWVNPKRMAEEGPIPIEGSEFDIDIDLLIPAVSQSPDISFLPEEIGLEISKWARLAVNPETFETNVQGIFAGGDFVTGPRDVIRVIADGRKAALSIHSYLSGESLQKRPAYFTPVPEVEIDPDLEKIPRQRMATLPVQERKSLHEEVALGFSKEAAVTEAARCLQCHVFTIFDRTKCILCGGCVDICPKSCFRMARLDEIKGDEKLSTLVESYYGVSHGRSGKAATSPPSSSKKNPDASSAASVPNDARRVRLRWRSITGNPSSIERREHEERDSSTYFRFGDLAIHLQNRNSGYGSETVHADVSQLLPSHLPREDETPWSSILLHVLSGRHFLPSLSHSHDHGHPSDVPLYAFHRKGLLRYAGSRPHIQRQDLKEPASMGCPWNGGDRLFAYG